ncbi:hypothetical protein ACE09Y_06515 [Raphidiopsis sp. BLCC-F218]|jgi:hypothetical protein
MNNLENFANNNHDAIRSILRAINFSQGQFSLIFLHCNCVRLHQEIAVKLRSSYCTRIEEINLSPSAISLYDNISATMVNIQPHAVMVFGLDTVNHLDSILQVSNQIREEFSKKFAFPLLIWIDDQILKRIIRIAPDLESWSTIIDFDENHRMQAQSLSF